MANITTLDLGPVRQVYKGEYSPAVSYDLLNTVFYQGESWVMIKTPYIAGTTPSIDSPYWQKIAVKGLDGKDGDKGDKGAKGDTGIQGPKGDKGDKGDTGPAGEGASVDLSAFAKKDLSNVTPTQAFIDKSVGWGIPDYSSEVVVSFNAEHTMPLDVFFIADGDTSQSNPKLILIVNGVYVLKNTGWTSSDGKDSLCQAYLFLKKGDRVKATGTDNKFSSCRYFPLRGAK